MKTLVVMNGGIVDARGIENRELRMAAMDYLDLYRTAWADPAFGKNARERINECAAILRAAGITHIHNIFGDIEIRGCR